MWGVRDHATPKSYGDAVLGGRQAIPEMLRRFEAVGIRATWATVGLLFARNRDEMLDFAPMERPIYTNPALSPYPDIKEIVGTNEMDDPLHFGHSLVRRIAETEGQEIATHTYSHFYCLEDGATPEAFAHDLNSAIAIAAYNGIEIRSIVFPRNQMADAYLNICGHRGITTYRGNPEGYGYQSAKGRTSLGRRAWRLADAAAPWAGYRGHSMPRAGRRPANVPASLFLRPYSSRFPLYSRMHLSRIARDMRRAAERNEVFHLWWHPHNFGRCPAANLELLDQILTVFSDLRERHGFQSLSMSDFHFRLEMPR